MLTLMVIALGGGIQMQKNTTTKHLEDKMNEIEVFRNRLKKIGIELELFGNVPWIYIDKVNGNKVSREDYNANHGYSFAWYPVRNGESPHLDWSAIKKTFEVIRKYK
jgi:hypothetical protein